MNTFILVCWLIAALFMEFEISKKPRAVKIAIRKAHLFVGLVLLGAWSSIVHADQSSIKVNAIVSSIHLGPPPEGVEDFNSKHQGWGIEYHFKDTGYYVGGGQFYNSFYRKCGDQNKEFCNKKSRYMGGGVIFNNYPWLGVEVGVADGYAMLPGPKFNGDIAVLYALTLTTKVVDTHALKFSLAGQAIILGYQAGFN